MPGRIFSLTGFLLAGGASRRMGQPKAGLILEDETMLARQTHLLGRVAGRVAVVGFRPDYLEGVDVSVIPDELPDRGPLGGIYTGLLHTRTEYNLFLGCDLPFVNRRLLGYVVRRARAAGAVATVPQSGDGRLQTLCAVYRRRARGVIRSSLLVNQNKLRSFFPKVSCQVIPWHELARAGFSPSVFDNMNTPADYDAARKRLEPRIMTMARLRPTGEWVEGGGNA